MLPGDVVIEMRATMIAVVTVSKSESDATFSKKQTRMKGEGKARRAPSSLAIRKSSQSSQKQ